MGTRLRDDDSLMKAFTTDDCLTALVEGVVEEPSIEEEVAVVALAVVVALFWDWSSSWCIFFLAASDDRVRHTKNRGVAEEGSSCGPLIGSLSTDNDDDDDDDVFAADDDGSDDAADDGDVVELVEVAFLRVHAKTSKGLACRNPSRSLCIATLSHSNPLA